MIINKVNWSCLTLNPLTLYFLFKVGLPTREERLLMLRRNLSGAPARPNLDLPGLSGDPTEGLSGSDLARMCEEARRVVFRRMVEEAEETRTRGRAPGRRKEGESAQISEEDLRTALRRVRPSGAEDARSTFLTT